MRNLHELETMRLELTTFALRTRRSPKLSYVPGVSGQERTMLGGKVKMGRFVLAFHST